MISSGFADLCFLALTEAIALGEALPEKYLLVDNKTDLGSNLTVEQEAVKAAEAQKVIDGAINKVGQLDATYSLLDTLDNIAGARPEVVDAATSYKLLDGVLTIEGPQTVAFAQAEIARGQALVDGSANAAGTIYKPVYELADTLANLEKAPVLVEGAVEYALTNEPGDLGVLTPAQIALVEGATDAAEYTWEIAPQSAQFTTQIDSINVANQAGEVTVKDGVQTGAFATQTFQTGDSVIGNGAQTIVEVLATNGALPASIVTLTDVGRVEISAASGPGAPSLFNATKWTNVGEAWVNNNNAIGDGATLANGSLATTYGVRDSAVATTYNVGIRAADLTGTSDTLTLASRDSGSVRTTAGAAPVITAMTLNGTSAGVENVELNVAGTNAVILTDVGAAAATDYRTVNVKGAGTSYVDVSALANVRNVDMSGVEGADSAVTLDFTAGGTVANVLQNNTTIQGSAGTDTLRIATAGQVITGLTVSAVEALRLDSGANSTVVFAGTAPNFTTIQFDQGVAGIKTLTNVGTFQNLNYVGDGLTANAAAAKVFNGLVATGGFTGGSDALAINFSNVGVTTTNAAPYTVGAINVTGVETFNINVADNTANAPLAMGALTSSTLTTVTAVSNGVVNTGVIDTGVANTNSITAIDWSGVTGNAVSAITIGGAGNTIAAAATITAGVGGLTATVNSVETVGDVLTFTGAAGADTLASVNYTGNVIFNAANGGNTLTLGNTVAGGAAASTVTATGGTGVDTYTLVDTGVVSLSNFGVGLDVLYLAGDVGAGGTGRATQATINVAANWASTNASTIVDAGGGAGAVTATFNLGAAVTAFSLAALDTTAPDAANVGATINAFATTAATITGTNIAAVRDTITGSSVNDNITGGLGFDLLTGNGGNDSFAYTGGTNAIVGQDAPFVNAFGATAYNATTAATAAATAGATATGNFEVITDINVGDSLQLGNTSGTFALAGTQGQQTNNTYTWVSGTWNAATGTFTIGATLGTGTDTLLMFDADAANTLNNEQVVLVGVTNAEITAATLALGSGQAVLTF